MKIHLLTYATADFLGTARNLADSALAAGFESVRVEEPASLKNTVFQKDNARILSERRGSGFWLWKPYLILKQLKELPAGECLFYSDAGRTDYYSFTSLPHHLIDLMTAAGKGYLLGCPFPHLGSIRHWTKRDCLEVMGATEDVVLNGPLLMTWSLWTNTPEAIAFLEEWLAYACDPRCLTDWPNELGKPNLTGFKEHRFDQSIMSILAIQKNSPTADFSNSLTQRLLAKRPGSEISNTFYKRPQNAEDLLRGYGPILLVREYLRLRKFRRQ